MRLVQVAQRAEDLERAATFYAALLGAEPRALSGLKSRGVRVIAEPRISWVLRNRRNGWRSLRTARAILSGWSVMSGRQATKPVRSSASGESGRLSSLHPPSGVVWT